MKLKLILPFLLLSAHAFGQQQTIISFYYLGGTLGVNNEIVTAMEDRVMKEMSTLFVASKQLSSSVCVPSPTPPKKICLDFSERVLPMCPGDAMGYTIYKPPSLLAGLVKSKINAWVLKQLDPQKNLTMKVIGEGLAVLPIHEIGHACGVQGDYPITTSNQDYYMATLPSSNYAKSWYESEKITIQSVCSPATSPPPVSAGRVDRIPDLPIPPQTIPFYYLPGNTVTNLSSYWGFKDVLNFQAIQGSEGAAPNGYYSTSITKTPGTSYGWASTPIFTQVDRMVASFTLTYDASWTISNANPLASTNFLCVSLSKWNGSSFSYDYNFYYRPRNWMDAYETNDYLIYKSGFSSLIGQAPSHDVSTWTGGWNSFKITVDKVQAAGGTGQIKYYGYNAQSGWRLFYTVVDNTYTTFNSVDVWHSTDPSAETTVKIDNIVVRKGFN